MTIFTDGAGAFGAWLQGLGADGTAAALVVLFGATLTLAWVWGRRGRAAEPAKAEPAVTFAKGYQAPSELFDVRTCAACRKATWVRKGTPSDIQALCPECRVKVTAPTPTAGPAEAKAPTAPPAPRMTWRQRRAKARALAAAYRDALPAHLAARQAKRRDAQRVLVEADREAIATAFKAWDDRESAAIHDEMIDDLRPFYPDASDEQLERIAASLAKAPVFPTRGGNP